MYDKELERQFAKNIYLKIANRVFKDYDKIYRVTQKQTIQRQKTTSYKPRKQKSGLTGLGITYCLGCGIVGLIKGFTK